MRLSVCTVLHCPKAFAMVLKQIVATIQIRHAIYLWESQRLVSACVLPTCSLNYILAAQSGKIVALSCENAMLTADHLVIVIGGIFILRPHLDDALAKADF